jgi:hypothetical protein
MWYTYVASVSLTTLKTAQASGGGNASHFVPGSAHVESRSPQRIPDRNFGSFTQPSQVNAGTYIKIGFGRFIPHTHQLLSLSS